MKKLFITLFFCTTALTSCSGSKIGLLGRLGLFRILKDAQRPVATVVNQKAIAAPKVPIYTDKNTSIRELFPVQPSSDSAVARKALELLMAKLTAPIKAFRNSFRVQYRDPQLERDLADIRGRLAALQREEAAIRNLLNPRPSASPAA